MSIDNSATSGLGWRAFVGFLALLALFGAALTYAGMRLVLVGGTPYYILTGLAVIISAALLIMKKPVGFWLFALTSLATLIWAIYESGANGWAYIPRLGWLIAASIVMLLFWPVARKALPVRPVGWFVVNGVSPVIMLALILIQITWPSSVKTLSADQLANSRPEINGRDAVVSPDGNVAGSHNETNWTAYAGSNLGNHYSSAAQINVSNVAQLQQVWDFRHGDNKPAGSSVKYRNEATPLKVGNSLYMCTPSQQIVSFDAETGKENWRFDSKVSKDSLNYIGAICRGVSYYETPASAAQAAPEVAGDCRTRIVWGTVDMRLGAVDAKTGTACEAFGTNGFVDLSRGVGKFRPGSISISSAPLVSRGNIIVGAMVIDSDVRPAPSGVIRAFDAVSGQMKWAWDLGRPANDQVITQEPDGENTYTLSTPNAWGPMSGDDELGLVYVALGNPAGDFYGGTRTPEEEKYGSALVALNVETGQERWHFQTVHHDLWDYDLSPQPNLADFPDDTGKLRPAVIQGTKSGHLYVLDRATGESLIPLTDVPVPQGTAPGDHTSPTQPVALGTFPNTIGEPGKDIEVLTEASTWGLTPFDQIACRMDFRKARYEGIFTPPIVGQETLVYPGHHGGMNWGGFSVDVKRGLMVINTQRLPYLQNTIERSVMESLGAKSFQDSPGQTKGYRLQQGQAYGATKTPWLSVLNQPCIAPPWGYLAAIDLKKRDVVWTQPYGTGYDSGPMGIPSRTKFQIGVPSDATGLSTAGGITVIGAALDNFIRAYNTETGELIWEQRLPAGNQAAPMTYIQNGRQYIVAVVGGHDLIPTKLGDHVIAWALPAQGQ